MQTIPFLTLALAAALSAASACQNAEGVRHGSELRADGRPSESGSDAVSQDGDGLSPSDGLGTDGVGVTKRDSDLDSAAGSDAAVADALGVIRDASPADTAEVAGMVPSHGLSYEAESGAQFGQAMTIACASCSNGKRVAIKADSGFTLSGLDAGGAGTNILSLSYVNGGPNNLSIYVGVNGNDSQRFLGVFPPTGGWNTVSSVSLSMSGFKPGTNNSLQFFIDAQLGAPDLDRITMFADTDPGILLDHCSRLAWKATASVTAGDGSGPAGGIDGDVTTRWANNRPQDGTDWYQVDFGASVVLGSITLNTQIYPNDYPRGFAILGSSDGFEFGPTPFATGNGTVGSTVINFSQQVVRAVRVKQTGAMQTGNWWQIAEFQVTCSRAP
jgi:hypothetical protein